MSLDDYKNIAVVIGAVVGCISLLKAVHEYTKQSAQKRAEEFFRMDKEFMERRRFSELFALLERDEPELRNIDSTTKMEFLRFYEKIALMRQSGLLKPYVAHYMFAYYAIRCVDSEHFWADLNKDSHYWALFVHFAESMKSLESKFAFKARRYKF